MPMLDLRTTIEGNINMLEMLQFSKGYESALEGLDELSNIKHNENDTIAAEVLRWAAKELRGENA